MTVPVKLQAFPAISRSLVKFGQAEDVHYLYENAWSLLEASTSSDDDDEDMETQCDCAGGHAVQGARTEGNECVSVVIITK